MTVNHLQNDWSQHLHLLEFAYNSAVIDATKHSPFEVNCGCNPLTPIALVMPSKLTGTPTVDELLEHHRAILQDARNQIHITQQRYTKYANQGHQDVQFQEGNLMLVKTRDFVSDVQAFRLNQTLQHKYMGPYKMLQKLSSVTYRIEFPKKW